MALLAAAEAKMKGYFLPLSHWHFFPNRCPDSDYTQRRGGQRCGVVQQLPSKCTLSRSLVGWVPLDRSPLLCDPHLSAMSSLTRRGLSRLSQYTEPLPVSVTTYLGFCNWSGLQAKDLKGEGVV